MSKKIDQSKCMACGMCVDECRLKAIVYGKTTGNGYNAPVILPDLCCDCGVCADVCPGDAIE